MSEYIYNIIYNSKTNLLITTPCDLHINHVTFASFFCLNSNDILRNVCRRKHKLNTNSSAHKTVSLNFSFLRTDIRFCAANNFSVYSVLPCDTLQLIKIMMRPTHMYFRALALPFCTIMSATKNRASDLIINEW